MTGSENLNEIKASFSWFQFIIKGMRSPASGPRVIIEKTEEGASVSILPSLLRIDTVQKALHLSEDDLRSLMGVLINPESDCFDHPSAPYLLDASSRAGLARFGLSRILSESEWTDFLYMLFSKAKIHQPEEETSAQDIMICDGNEWFIDYRIRNVTYSLSGFSDYPKWWKQFIAHLRRMTSFSGLRI